MIIFDLGIMAYNEAKNIGQLLKTLRHQRFFEVGLDNIFVIASGCTDGTEDIVKRQAQKDGRIKLLIQKKREGKASAINLFLKNAKNKILVLEGGDTLPAFDCLEKLVLPFRKPEIGMTGGRIIPLNKRESFMGFIVHLQWHLHHLVSLKKPKMGELVAFRKVFQRIPRFSAVDEANIEPLIKGQAYKIQYVPEAVVYNKGPKTLKDFLRQRKRIFVGHLSIKESQGYMVSTMSGWRIFLTLLKNFEFNWRFIFLTPLAILFEVYARLLGFYDFYWKKETHSVWEVVETTKDLSQE